MNERVGDEMGGELTEELRAAPDSTSLCSRDEGGEISGVVKQSLGCLGNLGSIPRRRLGA